MRIQLCRILLQPTANGPTPSIHSRPLPCSIAILVLLVTFVAASAQTTAIKNIEPPKVESNIKVTFDEKVPGVIVVESGGQRLRVDTATQTVTRVTEPATDTAPKEDPATGEKNAAKEEYEEEDDDLGYEPYDYRLINVPTPKRVPKQALNMNFTHRFTQTITPIKESAPGVFGFDSFAVSSVGLAYGVTDKFYLNAYRSPLCQPGLCRTIELGAGYHLLQEGLHKAPLTMAIYGSVEGNDNFSNNYTFNIQAQLARSISKYVNVFFAPAFHYNANGNRRFNPKPEDFFPTQPLADQFNIGRNTGSFGFGVNARITRDTSLLFEVTPRVGFKLGRVDPIYDQNFAIKGFRNTSYPEIGFGIERDLGRHSFTLTFSNTQTTTTSRYNSSNLLLSPRNFVIGFNLFRRML